MVDVEQYTYKIFWSDEDQEWVGVCTEFGAPLSWLDPDKQAAERGIRTLVRESIEILEEHGESIPEPAVLAARQPAAVAGAADALHSLGSTLQMRADGSAVEEARFSCGVCVARTGLRCILVKNHRGRHRSVRSHRRR